MKILMLLAHPNPESFNHAIARRITERVQEAGHQVKFHDLYAQGFDPLLQTPELQEDYEPQGLLAEHCDDLKKADGLIIVHPNWRDQPPAILKGWIDRVIRAGTAFRYEGEPGKPGKPVGMLETRIALIVNTADCPLESERKAGFPLYHLWADHVLLSCGVRQVERISFHEVLFSSYEQRTQWIEEAGTWVLDHLNGLSPV